MADLGRQLADLLYGESQQPKETTGQKIARRLTGAGETAATIGTGLLGSVPAGLAGLTQLIPTRGRAPDVNRAAQKVEDVQSALTYLPRTETGQRYLQNTAGALETLGAPAEYLGEKVLQYTGSPAAATFTNVILDPVNAVGLPGSGKATVAATKAAGRAAMAAPRVAGDILSEALTPASRFESQRGAIKMKGGNWLAGEVEDATRSLKVNRPTHYDEALMLGVTPTLARTPEFQQDMAKAAAINNWVDKKLNRYIKNEMGTPEDPIRKLAEQGILHFEPQSNARTRGDAANRRALGPFGQMGQSQLAQAWEDLADLEIIPDKARDFQDFGDVRLKERNPWLEKVDPETDIYATSSMPLYRLGFDHLIDVLKEDLATGRLTPEQLDKVSMEQAVRRAHQYDQEMAEKAAKATASAREGLPVYKEYPQGYRWIELNKPGAFSAESDSMGHSVRGYEPPKGHPDWTEGSGDAGSLSYGHGGWEGIKSGKAKVYSLVDSKGRPHVTIEVGAYPEFNNDIVYYELTDQLGRNPTKQEWDEAMAAKPPEITQIKGKQNRAPKEDYLPFVQDFVRSGNWSNVRDMQNTGLFKVTQGQRLPGFSKEIAPGFYTIDDFKRMAQENEMPQEIQDAWFKKLKDQSRYGYKKGGSVRISDNPDTMRLELATGGAVGQERSIGSKLVGGGIRGAGMRAIFGMDLPEDATKAEREVYANVTAMTNTPTPFALAAAPAALVKGVKGATKAAKEVPPPLPRAAPKTKAEIEAIAERMAPQMLGEYVRKSPESAVTVAGKTKKQFEREKELSVKLTGEAKTPEAVDIQTLKGKAMMGILGDPSITGRELESVGDIRLGMSSPQHGGPLYGMGREDEAFWASGKGAAKKVQNLADEISKQYGTDVLGNYILMGPEGLNYAQHFADANLQAIDLSKMTKAQREQFNSLIRKGSKDSGPRPSFPGIEDKEGAYLHLAFDPELRKHFNSLMQMNTVTRELNLPSGNDIRFAITEPLLRDLERGVTGMSIGQMKPGAALTLSEHPTYEMNIPGKFMGGSKYPVPYELMFPDTVKSIRENPRQAPQEFGSLGMVGPRQIIDQQMIDEIKAYEERMKRLTGKKKGGAVKKQAGGAIKAAAKAAEKAAKPSAEQAAKLAALREKMVPRAELAKKIMEENLDKPLSDIEEGGLTKAMQALPKKKGGKVKFTNNLDAMRLALKK